MSSPITYSLSFYNGEETVTFSYPTLALTESHAMLVADKGYTPRAYAMLEGGHPDANASIIFDGLGTIARVEVQVTKVSKNQLIVLSNRNTGGARKMIREWLSVNLPLAQADLETYGPIPMADRVVATPVTDLRTMAERDAANGIVPTFGTVGADLESVGSPAIDPSVPLDVWLKLAPESQDEDGDEYDDAATHEANTFQLEDGRVEVRWYLNAVGLVTRVQFDSVAEAHAWYEREGFQDFSS